MFSKNNLRNIDFTTLLLMSAIVGIGVVMIGSAHGWSLDTANFTLDPLMARQVLGYGIGLVMIFLILLLNYEVLRYFVIPLFLGVLLLLVLVLFIGVGSEADGDNVRRWIELFGGFNLQPSEFGKIALILLMAWYLNLYQDRVNNFLILLILGAVVGLPVLLVYKEPDLSTTVVYIAIIFFLLFNAKLSYRYIIPIVALGVLFVVFVYYDALSGSPVFLGEYQALRILAWKNPEQYALSEAYQTIRSTNAIGSGGLFGVGLFHNSGTVPVATTDFIFCIIGEELGFVGALGVILLLLLLFFRILWIARKATDLFGRLLCIGVAASIGVQSAIHIGVCTGAIPNTGIPLPFVSYGLSSLVSSMAGIGLVLKVFSESRQNSLVKE